MLGIGSESFTPTTNGADTPTANPLRVDWYEAIGSHTSLDTIDWSTPTRLTQTGNIEWEPTPAPWEPNAVADEFAVRISGAIRAHASGQYRFRLGSDEGSRLIINEQSVIENDGVHAMTTMQATITLEAGLHPFRLDYFERTGLAGLVLEWMPPGATQWTVIPESSFAETPAPIQVEWFYENSEIRRFEDIDWTNTALITGETQINWANRSGSGFLPGSPDDLFALRATTRLIVPESGWYTFRLGSDDGSRLTIDGDIIINRNNLQSFRWQQQQVYLTQGTKDVEILFFENFGWAGLILMWQRPGDSSLRVIPSESFTAPSTASRPRVVRWQVQPRIERERDPIN